MAARKGPATAVKTSSEAVAHDDVSSTLATDPLPTVRVNKSHLAEIKTALDDIVKDVSMAPAQHVAAGTY